MLSETNKTTARQRAERQGAIMKVTKKDAMKYAKENWITERERIVDTSWKNEILTVITITKETHLVYKLVIVYDDIDNEYCRLTSCCGYMFTCN